MSGLRPASRGATARGEHPVICAYTAAMARRSIGPGLWWGTAVLVLAALLAGLAAFELWRRGGEPESLTATEAVARVHGGGEIAKARIVGPLDCDQRRTIGRHEYVGARSYEPAGPDVVVIVRLEPDARCETVVQGAGRIREAMPALAAQLAGPGEPHVIELLLPDSVAWMFWVAAGLALFGVVGLRSGVGAPTQLPPRRSATTVESPRSAAASEGDPFRVAGDDEGLLRRPLRPSATWFRRERRTAMLHASALWICMLVAGVWATSFAFDADRVHRIWTTGLPAIDPELDGEETARQFVFRTTTAKVAYTDHTGKRHEGELWFPSIAVDDGVAAAVRYDRDAPDDFATSCEHERLGGRIALVVLGSVGLLLLGGLGSVVARARLREIANARETIHAGGVELVLRVVDTQQVIAEGRAVAIEYTLELPGGRTLECRRPADRPPFLLHVATRRVLGLGHPQRPELVVLLDPDLGPLEVEPDEGDRVRARYQAQRDAQRSQESRA